MSGLRIEVDLDKIGHNACRLVDRTARRNISITGVTKAMLGAPDLARVLCVSGVGDLGDSRIENIERMRDAGIDDPKLLLRSPMPSQVERVVRSGAMSVNTETDVLTSLAAAARVTGRVHDVMLMVELGDLREGVMPSELNEMARHVLRLPTLRLRGIGANLACRNGIEPSAENMGELSELVESLEAMLGIEIEVVSGGNSANLEWAFGPSGKGRINNLRIGEAVLLGREPLHRRPIDGLHTDAVKLVAEVIESNRKPTKPSGRSFQNSFGETPEILDRGTIWQTILAVGRQDTDAGDLLEPNGVKILAASSDHLLVETQARMKPGDELTFEPGYSAVLRSMTSPFVTKSFTGGPGLRSDPDHDHPEIRCEAQTPARRMTRPAESR
ncbi:MAG: alanine/ornithine racemase family PLP-dependent enzyme [Acidimicrobiales bacterium]